MREDEKEREDVREGMTKSWTEGENEKKENGERKMEKVQRRCNTPQHNATHCNALQHAATHCNTL